MGVVRHLIWSFLLPLTLAASIDPYHDIKHRTESVDKRSTSSSNAGIWDNVDWHALADRELAKALEKVPNTNKAKNVIMFIGDGMGVSTIAAARLYHAESRKLKREDIYLPWERFPDVALSRTYNVDRSTPDSAGTGTAYLCGVKANIETIGVTDKVKFGNCSAVTSENKVRSIVKESIAEGKWTGVVTTTRITHASPAAGYAHVSDRDWEAYMPSNAAWAGQRDCDDIAKQLIRDEENTKIRVILGGGRQMFLPNSSQPEFNNEIGRREDGLNLINEWRTRHTNSQFVKNKAEFDAVNIATTDYLMGLFSAGHMDYDADRTTNQPSLAEMTEKAIQMLKRSDNGYFLFVEGGRIDHSHHDGVAFKALHDTLALADAVKKAVDMTSDNDTLIVVTADHSHVFTLGGYATFEASIFDVTDTSTGDDGKPFLQLHYANGPGFYPHRSSDGTVSGVEQPRLNLSGLDTGSRTFKQDASVPLGSETHGGEDVAIFAQGPMSHLFHGVHEQNYIARVMMYASCVGRDLGPHCSISGGDSFHANSRHLTLFYAAMFAFFRQMALCTGTS